MASKKQTTLGAFFGSQNQQRRPTAPQRHGSTSSSTSGGQNRRPAGAYVPLAFTSNQPSTSSQRWPPPSQSSVEPETIDLATDDDCDDQELLLAAEQCEAEAANRPEPQTSSDFDHDAGRFWVFPTNMEKRQYQYDIVKQALFANTLVCLPTGLGKTFIANVVIYNFYRWYPLGKCVFVVPTLHLANQQLRSFLDTTAVPLNQVVKLTGNESPASRVQLWQNNRVFFMTAQTLTSDMERGACPTAALRCVVFDEAHKASGNHAYCVAMRQLVCDNSAFRVLALTATPGNSAQTIQKVLSNLEISRVDVRTDEMPDVRPYVQGKNVEIVVVPLSDEIRQMKAKFEQALAELLELPFKFGVVNSGRPQDFNTMKILEHSRQFYGQSQSGSGRGNRLNQMQVGMLKGRFSLLQSMYHAYELLVKFGLRSLYNCFTDDAKPNFSRIKGYIQRSEPLKEVWHHLETKYGTLKEVSMNQTIFLGLAKPSTSHEPQTQAADLEIAQSSHPKLKKLLEILSEHFQKAERDGVTTTKAMVFSQFRDSVNDIANYLRRFKPLIRPAEFTGKGGYRKKRLSSDYADEPIGCGTGKGQLKTVEDFKRGKYNVLVSTCVGEEGLDVGEVDLIISYHALSSQVRSTQRQGRTGRKRFGRAVQLVTEGQEENVVKLQSQRYSESTARSVMTTLTTRLHRFEFCRSPRMIPNNVPTPQCKEIKLVPVVANISEQTGGRRKRQNVDKAVEQERERAAKARREQAYLTEREMQLWDTTMKLTIEEKQTTMSPIQLGRGPLHTTKPTSVQRSTDVFDHSGVCLWQRSLQEAPVSGHSDTTRGFVELMRSIADPETTANGPLDTDELQRDGELAEEGITDRMNDTIDRFCQPASDCGKQQQAAGRRVVKAALRARKPPTRPKLKTKHRKRATTPLLHARAPSPTPLSVEFVAEVDMPIPSDDYCNFYQLLYEEEKYSCDFLLMKLLDQSERLERPADDPWYEQIVSEKAATVSPSVVASPAVGLDIGFDFCQSTPSVKRQRSIADTSALDLDLGFDFSSAVPHDNKSSGAILPDTSQTALDLGFNFDSAATSKIASNRGGVQRTTLDLGFNFGSTPAPSTTKGTAKVTNDGGSGTPQTTALDLGFSFDSTVAQKSVSDVLEEEEIPPSPELVGKRWGRQLLASTGFRKPVNEVPPESQSIAVSPVFSSPVIERSQHTTGVSRRRL